MLDYYQRSVLHNACEQITEAQEKLGQQCRELQALIAKSIEENERLAAELQARYERVQNGL